MNCLSDHLHVTQVKKKFSSIGNCERKEQLAIQKERRRLARTAGLGRSSARNAQKGRRTREQGTSDGLQPTSDGEQRKHRLCWSSCVKKHSK